MRSLSHLPETKRSTLLVSMALSLLLENAHFTAGADQAFPTRGRGEPRRGAAGSAMGLPAAPRDTAPAGRGWTLGRVATTHIPRRIDHERIQDFYCRRAAVAAGSRRRR